MKKKRVVRREFSETITETPVLKLLEQEEAIQIAMGKKPLQFKQTKNGAYNSVPEVEDVMTMACILFSTDDPVTRAHGHRHGEYADNLEQIVRVLGYKYGRIYPFQADEAYKIISDMIEKAEIVEV